MVLKVRNSGAGIGDQVCGLYVCQALKARYPEADVEYFTKHPDWLTDVTTITLRPYEHYFVPPPAHADIYLDSSTPAYRALHPMTRKEIYAARVGVPGLTPCPPHLRRKHRHAGEGHVVLFPFSAWRDREWPAQYWREMEKNLLQEGFRVSTAATADRSDELAAFKGEKHVGLRPDEVVNLMQGASCIVANDSGMAHLAGMYSVPGVAVISTLFSCKHLFCQTGIASVSARTLRDVAPADVLHTVKRVAGEDAKRRIVLSAGDLGTISVGGAYNGCIFEHDGVQFILCRAESHPETARPVDSSAVPVLVRLGSDLHPLWHRQIDFIGGGMTARIEDFRVFRFGNELLVAHPMVYRQGCRLTRQALSRLDIDTGTMTLLEEPMVPGQGDIEKNWVYFENRGRLMLLYSAAPYRIFTKTVVGCELAAECEVTVPWSEGRMVSNSTHPVPLDEDGMLLFIHVRADDGVYRQGAMRIDTRTLLPTHVSRRPLYYSRNARGLRSGVVYFMGAVRRGERILVSMGEGDYHTSIVEFSVENIKNQMIPIP